MSRVEFTGVRRSSMVAIATFAACLAGAASAAAKPMVYVANSGTDDVTPLASSADGALTAGAPVPVGNGPLGAAATPDGRYLYVALNEADSVAALAIAPGGTLEPVPGSPFPAGVNPSVPAVTPNGRHLYVANFGGDTISIYDIKANGSLDPRGDIATQDGPSQLAFTPDGSNLYAPNFGSSSISAFNIIADGIPSGPVSGSPFATSGTFPANAAISPDGDRLYVSRRQGGRIEAFTIAASGALTPVPGSPFVANTPEGIAFSADGKTAYAASFGGNLLQTFAVAANGALTAEATTPVGVGPTAVATALGGKVLHVVNASTASVSSFAVESGGALTPTGLAVPTGGASPSGRAIAVVDTDDSANVRLKVSKRPILRGRNKVFVQVVLSSPEKLETRVKGTIKVRGQKAKLKPQTITLDSAPLSTITVLKPAKRTAAKRIARALRAGGKAKATIKAVGTDELGNVGKTSARVKLKAKPKK